jgi:hypothetical protein
MSKNSLDLQIQEGTKEYKAKTKTVLGLQDVFKRFWVVNLLNDTKTNTLNLLKKAESCPRIF